MASSVVSPVEIPKPQTNKGRLRLRETLVGYMFIAPNMLVFAIWVLFPVLFTFLLSFAEWDFITGLDAIEFVGLENYAELPNDIWFVDSVKNTFLFTLGVVPAQIALGLLFALIMNNQIYVAPAIRAMLFMPYITSPIAVAAVWLSLFNPRGGPINQFLYQIGIQDLPGWLASSDWALVALIIIGIWSGLGYNALIFIAGLQSVPDELYESAEIDGAGLWAKFWNVTFPMISPTTFFLLITGVISSFRVFELVAVMTQGGPGTSTTVLAYHVYRTGFVFYRMGYASTIAVALLVIVFIFTLIQWYLNQRYTRFMRPD